MQSLPVRNAPPSFDRLLYGVITELPIGGGFSMAERVPTSQVGLCDVSVTGA